MQNNKVIATIEARMGSTRLPAKVLKPLAGEPMLQRIVERAKLSKYIERIVIATTIKPVDDEIIKLAKKLGLDFFRGSEDDVLKRLSEAIKEYKTEVVVCLTGDNPLIDPVMIDDMLDFFFDGGFDYVASTHMHHSPLWAAERTFPVGVSVQVVKAKTLLEIDEGISEPAIREHGTFGIYHRSDNKYKLGAFQAEEEYKEWRQPNLRFTVDTHEDYELMSRIYEKLYFVDPKFSTLEAIRLVLNRPELRAINAAVIQRIASPK
ncbi:MAG: glycosyltransferase family protein [Nitrospirae bacterium]|nr:glycosyltransferase family protein [Nitrospirota bacterium]